MFFGFFLKYISKFLLKQLGVFLLSFAFHEKYLWYKFSEILGQALISAQANPIPPQDLVKFFQSKRPI